MKPGRILLFSFLVVCFSAIVFSLISLHAHKKLREKAIESSSNRDEILFLRAEYERLCSRTSNFIETVSIRSPNADDELQRLTKEAEQLSRQKAELLAGRNDAMASAPLPADFNFRSRVDYQSRTVVTESTSQQYKEDLVLLASTSDIGQSNPRRDAQNLADAARKYAKANNGRFPTNFNVAMLYLHSDQPSPLAEEFELVFHGSTNDLNGIPHQSVALIRQRNAWPTPAGQSARIYVMADGLLRIVESADSFQSWEASHIVPPE